MSNDKTSTQLSTAAPSIGLGEDRLSAVSRPTYLVVISGGLPGALHRLGPQGTNLGRARENGIRFADLGVSRVHASVVVDGQGEAWITDLASTNGTFLNGERLPAKAPRRLRDGDRVRFGPTVLVKFVRLDASEERFHSELFERAVRDPLTGLFHRGYFLEQAGPLAALSEARGLGIALLMLDVDHFKRVNDNLGHDAGDHVLREVSSVLRESTREDDLVARYGGEEFVIALPVAAPDLATERAERVRVHIEQRTILAPDFPDAPIRVTVSIGLAFSQPGRLRPVPALISAADRCLYAAKRSGRNRVVIRVDPTGSSRSNQVTPRDRDA